VALESAARLWHQRDPIRSSEGSVMTVRGMLAALALAGAVTAGAEAAPFRAVSDAEGLWVLDEESGALKLCRTTATAGPKVLDVFGGAGEARQGKAYPGRPDCVAVARPGLGGAVPDPAGGYGGLPGLGGYGMGGPLSVAVRPGMLGDGSSGYQVGSAFGMLGDGRFGYDYGAPDNQVIIIRPEWINVTLD
jgi:hypothetical protein